MPPRGRVEIVGPYDTPEGQALRDFLTRIDQHYEWNDDEAARVERSPAGDHRSAAPTVVIDDQTALVGPSLEQLSDALGIRYPPASRDYDLVIIGAGPAGLAAAVYAASDGLRTVVAERGAPGGQAAHTARIENYFGIDPRSEPMTGARLARIGGRQAETFGAELLILRGVVGGGVDADGTQRVLLSTGEELRAAAAICATGVEWRRLDLPGLDELLGHGVYYGAGRSETPRFHGQRVAIVGAGNSAGQAALNFAEHAERVTMLCRGAALAASLSRYLAERIECDPRIDVRTRTRVTEVHSDGALRAITVADDAGREERLGVTGLFIAIGGVPQTQWAEGTGLERDDGGYLVTGRDLGGLRDLPAGWPLERAPHPLESSLPGFFVAGDVRHGSTKRVAAAVGEGAMAVSMVHRCLEERSAAHGR